jgi:hypothetical protein
MPNDGKRDKNRRKKQKDLAAARYLTNKDLATYAGISAMTLWRWKRNPELRFPPARVINQIEHNDRLAFDRWMKRRPTRQSAAENLKELAA